MVCNPKEMSRGELERLTRRYTTELMILLGPEKDIPAPDIYTDAQTMAWIMDTYSMNVGYSVPSVVTGKPLSVGGSRGRKEATGRGVVLTTLEAMKELGIPKDGATVAVQGFGNVGGTVARLLYREGFRVIGISDYQGGTYNPKGLDVPALTEHEKEAGTVVGFPGGEDITNEELLALKCDVLVPAALENQITEENADKVRAKIVTEGANGPTTPEADTILYERGIFVIPDILANAGGVTVSYFEWVQSLQAFFWSEEEVNARLKDIMVRSFHEVYEIHRREQVDMRLAAYILAVGRVAEAFRTRGLYP